MAQHRERPIGVKTTSQSSGDQSAPAGMKKSSSHGDLAQAIRREIDRAIG